MITLSCAVRASICQRMHFIAPSMLLLRIVYLSCNSNLLTCTFLLCNLLKRVHLLSCVRKQIAQIFFYNAICSYSRISRLLTLTFSFLNLLSNFMKISQYRKRKKKFYSQKTWRSQMRYYIVMYSYLDIF